MSAYLAPQLNLSNVDPSKNDKFFDDDERKIVRSYINTRECNNPENKFPPPCDVNLSLGFFFDGTNNNLNRDRKGNTHSNVARLYSAFPGSKDKHGSEAWPGFADKYHNSFSRIYIPGCGTEFDQVGDTGKGFNPLTSDRASGLAFANLSSNRILWALVEALNSLNQYYLDHPLLDEAEFKKTVNKLSLPPKVMATEILTDTFTKLLHRLHANLKSYLPADAPGKSNAKGKVIKIFVSLFGFSRGSAEVRAFANWFIWLCKLDADIFGKSGITLGSIDVQIDFMGLFDTVASVGIAATAKFADGHQSWADTEISLKIPEHEVHKCLHIVSAHEIRRSFPLDSVMYRTHMPANCQEIVFPGVHSDVGGGYKPNEQGRSSDADGANMLSRISLAMMYRAARLAGVPLKLEEAPQSVKDAFKIAPSVIHAFNAYIGYCNADKNKPNNKSSDKTIEQKPRPLHEVMEDQHRLYILWRKKMAGNMKNLPNVLDSSVHKFDKTDIEESDKELEQEIKNFETWRKAPNPAPSYSAEAPSQTPFSNPEWKTIEKYWDDIPPPESVTNFFEKFVHDSRAWFKPFGKDIPNLIHAMELLAEKEERERTWKSTPRSGAGNPHTLTAHERKKLIKYKTVRGTPEVMTALEPDKKGREPIDNCNPIVVPGGYLRFRRIYMGSDSYKPNGAMYAGLSIEKVNSGSAHIAERAALKDDAAVPA